MLIVYFVCKIKKKAPLKSNIRYKRDTNRENAGKTNAIHPFSPPQSY